MLTPAFELSQDSEFLTLVIRVPYTRTSEFDLYIDGDDFKFYAKPYFLRLTLPGRIIEDGREKASFDIDKGVFTLCVPKEMAGQHFEGLQMLTSLLAPRGSRSAKPLVEDLEPCAGAAGAELEVGEDEGDEEEEEEEEFDWQVEQTAYAERPEEELQQLQKYGFGNLRSGVFARLQEELSDVIDVKDPDGTTAEARRSGRLASEHNKFDADHYLADLFEDEAIQSLLRFRPWWSEVGPEQSQSQNSPALEFSEDDKDQMRKFTNRSYLLDKLTRRHVWLGLVDIVLSYAYEIRVTEGEHNVESPWNIRKLSGTLCWLETYHSLQEVLVSFGRRVVSYPLHRHFALITAALRDAAHIFQAGKACVLKCLLDIHKIFRENDPAYILNDLYITDYCIWIQKVKSKHVLALVEPLRKAALKKSDLGLELDELETAAALVEREQEEEEEDDDEDEDGSSSEEEEESDSSDDSSSSSSSSSSEDSDDCPTEQQSAACVIENAGKEQQQQQQQQQHHRGGKINSNNSPSQSPSALTLTPTPPVVPPAPAPSLSDAHSSERLIQELGERLEEGLRISAAAEQPAGTPSSSSSSSTEPERKREGEGEKKERGGRSEPAHTHSPTAVRSERTLLTACPRRNPLLVVKAEDLDSDDDEEDGDTCLPDL